MGNNKYDKILDNYREDDFTSLTFIELSDVPSTYTGQELKGVRVNATATGLEFFTGSGLVDWGEIGGTLSNQTDLQTALNAKANSLSGTINEIAYFNSATTIASLAVATYPSLTELSYVKGLTSVAQTQLNGKKPYMGVEAIGAVTFVDATHILSVASMTYWFNGVKYVTASPVTCDIDDYVVIANNNCYLFYFDASAGLLKCKLGATANYYTEVPIAIVFWNGTNGAIQKESHSYLRDLAWHTNAHLTIGSRYYTGLDKTLPTTVTDNQLSLTGGTIYDEDLASVIANPQTTCRIVYQVSLGVYTWVNSALPYAGTDGQPQYLDTDTWTLTNVGASDFVSMWVYATNDIDRPITIIPTQASIAHNTIALARGEVAPNIAALNLSPEMKLLYKFIYKGDGNFQESVDYRLTTSIPGGIPTTIGASAVTFVPTGAISAIDVQNAIAELDTEKLPLAGGTMTGGIVLVAGTTTIQPLKMVSGTNLTVPVAGVFEFDGTNLFFSV